MPILNRKQGAARQTRGSSIVLRPKRSGGYGRLGNG